MRMIEFHVHVDAQVLGLGVEQNLLQEHGFAETNFSGHPAGVQDFGPRRHLTLKCNNGREFRERFDRVVDYLRGVRMVGYLEGEYVASDVSIPQRPFDPHVTPPGCLTLDRLPPGKFRESEVHVTLCRDRSDPRLIDALCRAGFFASYLPKRDGTAIVFTAQGCRGIVANLLPRLTQYLEEAGGSSACSVKEERIVRWWLSGERVEIPPVVTALTW